MKTWSAVLAPILCPTVCIVDVTNNAFLCGTSIKLFGMSRARLCLLFIGNNGFTLRSSHSKKKKKCFFCINREIFWNICTFSMMNKQMKPEGGNICTFSMMNKQIKPTGVNSYLYIFYDEQPNEACRFNYLHIFYKRRFKPTYIFVWVSPLKSNRRDLSSDTLRHTKRSELSFGKKLQLG